MTTVAVRPRTESDVPVLVRLLAEQREQSGYPVRWPLPFPVERFIVRPAEQRAWVAEADGRVVGHVSVCAPSGELADLFATATGTDRLGEVSVLFVDPAVAARGIGSLLLDTAASWIRGDDRSPVLDVVGSRDRTISFYRHRGWRLVGETRPDWLPQGSPPLLLMALSATPAVT